MSKGKGKWGWKRLCKPIPAQEVQLKRKEGRGEERKEGREEGGKKECICPQSRGESRTSKELCKPGKEEPLSGKQ